MPPGRLLTHPTLTLTEADSSPQEGLSGALLAIARELPDGLLGEFQARTATVPWWREQQTTEPRLCAALVAVCTRGSIPNTDPSG
jgi:hypothetical protein